MSPALIGVQMRNSHQQKVDHSINALDHLLKALWQSEYQGRFRLYRLSMALLADLGLELGMTLRSRKLAEEVMPQVRVQ
jgi:anaphase-promoting complex subunit 5